jgi:Zn-dependent metalloprotease
MRVCVTTIMLIWILTLMHVCGAIAGQQPTPNPHLAAITLQSNLNGILKFDPDALVNAGTVFRDHKAAFGLGDDDAMVLKRADEDGDGMIHHRFQQTYKGIEVFGGVFLIHERDGLAVTGNGKIVNGINIDVTPVLTESEALARALSFIGAERYMWEDVENERFIKEFKGDPAATYYPKGELSIVTTAQQFSLSASDFVLAYRFDVFASSPLTRKQVFVDAVTGEMVQAYDRLREEISDVLTDYYGWKQVTTTLVSPSPEEHVMEQNYPSRGNGIEIFDCHDIDYFAGTNLTNSSTTWTAEPKLYNAYWAAEQVWDYYYTVHERSSYNNDPDDPARVYIYANFPMCNAVWTGDRIGLGNASTGCEGYEFDHFTALDVVGHEFTHAVTDYAANLVYSQESGALDESFSDIFGTLVEFAVEGDDADWLMGEDFTISYEGGNGFFRSLEDPHAGFDPDTYLGPDWYTGPSNRTQVHTNTGVQNYWFYLLCEGGSGVNDNGDPYTISGIGMAEAAEIAYKNLCYYLTPYSSYADARAGAIQAAVDLYGDCSFEAIETAYAWYAVGVGDNGDYDCGDQIDFYVKDCEIDNGSAYPSPCPRYWEYYRQHKITNFSYYSDDKWVPGQFNRLQTLVHNRGNYTDLDEPPDMRTARVFAYWTEAATGLTWPNGNRIYDCLEGHHWVDVEVLPGRAQAAAWVWSAPSEGEIEDYADHICVGFAINPIGTPGSHENETPPSGSADRMTTLSSHPRDDNNVAQINLVTVRTSSGPKADGFYHFTFPAWNRENPQGEYVKVEVDSAGMTPGWIEQHWPEDWFYVAYDSNELTDLWVTPPADVQHLDSCIIEYSTITYSDSAEPHGGIRISITMDDYAPDSAMALEFVCASFNPACCPSWVWPDTCSPVTGIIPLQWTVPEADIAGEAEKCWFFIMCRDTVPTVDLGSQIDTVVIDYDLDVAGFQWVNTEFDWGKTYYYRVYAVDQAGHVSGGSNVVEVVTTATLVMGDVSGDGYVDIDDIVQLICIIFGGCSLPDPAWVCDVNCDAIVDIDDVVYLINYVFVYGPAPGDPNDDGIPDCYAESF